MSSRFSFSNVFFKKVRRNPIGGRAGVPQNVGVLQAYTVCTCGYAWTLTENKGLNNALGGIMVTCPACKATEVLLLAEFESCQEEEQSVNDPLAFFAVPGVIQAREEFEEEAARAIAMKFPTHHGIKKKVTEIFNYLERDYSEPIDVLLMVEFYERIVK